MSFKLSSFTTTMVKGHQSQMLVNNPKNCVGTVNCVRMDARKLC